MAGVESWDEPRPGDLVPRAPRWGWGFGCASVRLRAGGANAQRGLEVGKISGSSAKDLMWGRGALVPGRLLRRPRESSSLSRARIAPFSGGSMLELWGPRLPPPGILLLLPFLLQLLLPAAPAPHRASYKPVIVVHGLFDSSYSFRHLLEYINEVWQGTPIVGLRCSVGRWLG